MASHSSFKSSATAMVLNRQCRVRVSLSELNRFAKSASDLLRLSSGSVTVCLVTEVEMTRWNLAYRGKNTPTDVLSFPSGERAGRHRFNGIPRKGVRLSNHKGRRSSYFVKGPDVSYLGDIAIAPSVARRNALRLGRRVEDEMRMLILHGMLHLMGYDHETDNGQMNRRERWLCRALGLA
jgi:probable rRNA maturation factor